VGTTDYAQQQLGDVVTSNFPRRTAEGGAVFGNIR
jgi:glycine cleavage system H lipoate-binding protein